MCVLEQNDRGTNVNDRGDIQGENDWEKDVQGEMFDIHLISLIIQNPIKVGYDVLGTHT